MPSRLARRAQVTPRTARIIEGPAPRVARQPATSPPAPSAPAPVASVAPVPGAPTPVAQRRRQAVESATPTEPAGAREVTPAPAATPPPAVTPPPAAPHRTRGPRRRPRPAAGQAPSPATPIATGPSRLARTPRSTASRASRLCPRRVGGRLGAGSRDVLASSERPAHHRPVRRTGSASRRSEPAPTADLSRRRPHRVDRPVTRAIAPPVACTARTRRATTGRRPRPPRLRPPGPVRRPRAAESAPPPASTAHRSPAASASAPSSAGGTVTPRPAVVARAEAPSAPSPPPRAQSAARPDRAGRPVQSGPGIAGDTAEPSARRDRFRAASRDVRAAEPPIRPQVQPLHRAANVTSPAPLAPSPAPVSLAPAPVSLAPTSAPRPVCVTPGVYAADRDRSAGRARARRPPRRRRWQTRLHRRRRSRGTSPSARWRSVERPGLLRRALNTLLGRGQPGVPVADTPAVARGCAARGRAGCPGAAPRTPVGPRRRPLRQRGAASGSGPAPVRDPGLGAAAGEPQMARRPVPAREPQMARPPVPAPEPRTHARPRPSRAASGRALARREARRRTRAPIASALAPAPDLAAPPTIASDVQRPPDLPGFSPLPDPAPMPSPASASPAGPNASDRCSGDRPPRRRSRNRPPVNR